MNSNRDDLKKGIMAMLCGLGYRYIHRVRDDNIWAYKDRSDKRQKEIAECVGLNWAREAFEDLQIDRILDIYLEVGDMIWALVPVNTLVLVRHNDTEPWVRRHFYKYNPDSAKPYECYWQGKCQFTIRDEPSEWQITGWEQIRSIEFESMKGV